MTSADCGWEPGDSPCCCPGARCDGRPERGAALMAARWAARGSQPERGVDEFTVPAEKSRLLEGSRGRIESLFEVRLAVLRAQGDWRSAIRPPGQPLPAASRIWVQLAGGGKAVRSAKEYIKGLCEPELEEKEYYPKDMHCIFVGAQSLFLNSLIQDTCADIMVLEIGLLSIKGVTEAVVMAQSHVQQFVKLFENNESLLSDNESEIKKQFRQFVESHADKYTMDLLILPSSLKRELLILTQTECCEVESEIIDLTGSESPTEFLQNEASKVIATNGDGRAGSEEARNSAGTPVTELTKQMDTVFSDAPETGFSPINVMPLSEAVVPKERQSCKRRSSHDEERLPKKPFSLENDQEVKPASHSNPSDSKAITDLFSDSYSESDDPSYCLKEAGDTSEEMEYTILVNFFRTMGYSQNIVEKVIGILGQSVEPLTLLEEIEKENIKFQKEHEQSSQKPRTINPPLGSNANNSQKLEDKGISSNRSPLKSSHTSNETKNEHHKIRDSPSIQVNAEGKTHMLVRKPASPSNKNSTVCYKQRGIYCPDKNRSSRSGDVETDGVNSGVTQALKDADFVARGSSDVQHSSTKTKTAVQQKSAGPSIVQNSHPVFEDQFGHCSSSPVRFQNQRLSQTSDSENLTPDHVLSTQIHPSDSDRETVGPRRHHSDPSITGVQRFLDSLKKPYKLELKNEPGNPYLKHIIIDGSNVAISHGLRKFFSCRGIAIAVDYFWKRGHRNITVFVPQWRTRRDPSTTEQDFLTQLQDVGILSLTPARMVLGTRIASHDDRFLLHLADKTGGVIVTNDNFREFVTESLAWRDIIQKRLLQYTFAGDIFMVPDDPLGRNGPRLDDFLRSEGCSRDFWSAQNALQRSGQHYSETSFSVPVLKPTSSSQQSKNRVHDDHSSTWLPLETNTQACLAGPPQRSASETVQLREALIKIFPDYEQRQKIDKILADHPFMRDLNALSAMVLD
ncbi:NEDD4-binding protein 1 isoform X1 [Falco peregrinus]|uniref:NEDD4-binding protein 1 isoform X1 n=2 Tax=Falco peregrinus TaxID=8954 RepID=UPI00247AFA76|nr:NEDD4-binding protein 1 isoform X1 [Falco peregrinus]